VPDSTQPPPASTAPVADEFAGIRPARRRPSLWAMVVVAFSVFLIFHQRNDVTYALSSSSPRMLGAVGEFMKAGAAELPENRYVRITGTPDFESALILDTQGEWKFRAFFRLLETDRKVFVQRAAGPLPLDMVQNNSFAGRLVRLQSVSFSESIRAYFARHVTSTRVFDPKEFRRALDDKRLPGTLLDKLGETANVAGNELLSLDVRVPLHYHVDVPRYIYDNLALATKVLTRAGAVVQGEGKSVVREANLSGFAFECTFPADKEAQVFSAVADIAGRTRIIPVVEHILAPLTQLRAVEGGLEFTKPGASSAQLPGASSAQLIDWQNVLSIRTTSTLNIPQDAYLLLEGELPSSHYKSVVATAFLLAFGLVNLLAFRRRA